MKKNIVLVLFFLFSMSITSLSYAADLLQVYKQALFSDPVYQQAIAQELATGENVPISRSYLLPNLGFQAVPSILKATGSGPASTVDDTLRERGYTYSLTLTQTIFDVAQTANLSQQKATAKQALATLNAASQDLMIRVAKAYFQVLQDEDFLRASGSAKVAFKQQLDQATQQYKVGLKTITDVYTAEASYQGSVADYIASETNLKDDQENLRAITGVLYRSLAKLSEQFPLISPRPKNINAWIMTAARQNWQIKANQYAVVASKENIRQQFAGHMPTVNVEGQYLVDFVNDMTRNNLSSESAIDGSLFHPHGTGQTHQSEVSLNVNFPIYEGGLVVAQTRQAQDQYQLAVQTLEQQIRSTMTSTRQSYLGILAGISKLHADKETIKAAISSLEGMKEGYKVGTEILVNVLNQQQQVLDDEKQYALDRYAYVNNLLALKEAAGTLSPDDLAAINAWLRGGEGASSDHKLHSQSSKQRVYKV